MSEYDDLIAGSLKPNPAQAARVGFTAAVDSNPDSIAEARRVAQRTGVPIDTVLNMPADMKRQDAVGSVDFDSLAQTSPATSALLADVDKAKLAHDNVDSLSGMEQLIRSAKRGWTAGLRGLDATEIDAAAQGLNRLANTGPIRNEPLRPRRNFTQADPATLGRLTGQYSRQLGENAIDFTRRTKELKGLEATGATKGFYEAKGWGDSFGALLSDPFEISGNVVAESLGIMAPGMPAMVAGGLAGGPVGLAGAVGATSYQAEYGSAIAEELQKSGIDLNDTAAVQAFVATPGFADVRRKAQIKAAVIGTFDAATAGVAGVRLRPSMAGNLAAQTGVQAAGGAGGEVAGSLASGQEVNASSVLAEAIGEIPGSIVDVATMAGRSALQGKQKADQAEQSAAFVENLNKLASADKLLQRDADSFEQFVAAAAEDGPVDTVYVDGRMLMQSGMSPKLAELSPSVREQLDRSILTGGLIAIPVSEYAARIAPTDMAPQLLDHLKTDAEGFTRAEAQDYMANQGTELQAEVERILTDRQDADTFRQSQDVVKQDILGQLNTAGRFTPQVNEAYATLASAYSAVRAAQMGLTPEAFHQQRGMRVQGAAVAGDKFDQAGKLVTDTPEFKNWFGESKVKDADSKPLAVYHGTRSDFESFNAEKQGTSGQGSGEPAFFFEESPENASRYATDKDGANVVPVYLSLKNPLVVERGNTKYDYDGSFNRVAFNNFIDDALELGHDGVVFRDVADRGVQSTQYAVFNPTQIKSAIGNRGTFDPADPNILGQRYDQAMDLPYQIDHKPMTAEGGASTLDDLTPAFGEDIYGKDALQFFGSGDAREQAVVKVLKSLRGKPDAEVTIYRGVPDGVGKINPGDWVTLSKEVAEDYASQHDGGRVVSMKVPARDVTGWADSLLEFGYHPADPNIPESLKAKVTGEGLPLFQRGGGANRGGFSPATNTVTLLKNADLSTFLHESAHYFFESDIQLSSELLGKAELTPGEQQIVDDVSKLLTWHGIQGGIEEQLRQWYTMDFEEQRSHHERTAESFEAYLFSGKAPSLELQPVFQRFAQWMVNVYKSLKDFLARNPEAGKLNDEVRSVFDRMIATREEIALAEQARSMMPLFASPETSGMTPDDYARYQAQGKEATDAAVEELQAKGLRDLQWLKNARGRQVTRLKRESKALRAEVEIEARREVMSQPVYRAWDFLTGKLGEKTTAQTENELEVTDWKQRRQEAMDAARDTAKAEAWDNSEESKREYEGGRAKGMAKGQFIARQKKDIDLVVARSALDWDRANPKPEYVKDSNVFDTGEQVFGKFNLAALEDMGSPDEIVARVRKLRMAAADGMHPDLIATLFEFSSGDELVRALASVQSPKEAITELADRMMLERHGELATPEAIELAADAAIHNDFRARVVTTEYNALAQATGGRKLLTAAAREYAAQIIAKLKIRDIRPSQYANAETRAAKAAQKASNAGDLATAAAEKRNQVINTYATRAAYDAQDEVKAGLRYLKKFDKRSKTIDPEYQDQIEAMLERFELRAISNKAIDRRASLAQWLTAQREAGLEPDISPELENEAYRTSYKNITVEEFRGLVDAVQQIEHLGRLKTKLMTARDKRAFKVIVEEVATSIVDNGGTARPVELETPKGIRPWLEGVLAGHRKIASLIRQMDGLKDGGAFWRVLVRGMNEASTNETVMIEQATVKLAELYKPMLALKGGLNGDKRFIPAINDSMTRGGRLSVALNWGNSANRQRVMDGDHWTEHQVNAILSTLSREEWSFVQNVWTFIDSYWPAIEAKEKRVTGRAPDKVAAEPFTYMVNGETISLSGGYYPIKYDSNRDDKAEKHDAAAVAQDMMRGAMTRSTTRRGHTKERMAAVNRPVKKTLDVITQHVSEVTHDLAWHEWLVDANRLLDAKPINQAIRDYYGTEVLRTMKDALVSIATADIIPQDRIDRALLYLRANVSRSTMGFSLTTAFLQPFGLLQSMVRIGTKPVLRGMARWAGDATRFESSMTWINEKSDFMRLRGKTFNRELHEIKGRVSHGHSKARTIYDASLFMLMQKMQMVADVPTWIGAYEKALADNQDDATAVALADQSVLDSQGGGQTKDMSAFQKSHPFMTMFYSYFNTTLNLAAESTAATNFKNPLAVAGWASDMALLMVIPALGPAMLLALMRGEECEGEECAVKLARAQGGYLMNLMLGLREFSGMASGFDYAGPPVGRVVTELQRTGKQVGQGEADEALAMSSIKLLGVSLGIPTTQILRSYKGWVAWEDGDAPVTSILMGPPPKD